MHLTALRSARSARPATTSGAWTTCPGGFCQWMPELMMGIDVLQRERGVEGDLVEIGTYKGKSAILLGHLLRASERLVVCDIFEDLQNVGQETLDEAAVWYVGLGRQQFEEQFLRFHRRLPTIWQMKSSSIDSVALAGSCRIVHVDGSHAYEDVRGDIATARTLLGPGGVAVFDDWSTAHVPGVALAIWEEFLRADAHLLCLSPLKAYLTWDQAGLRRDDVEGWVAAQPDLEMSYPHRLSGGHDVRSIASAPAAPTRPDDVITREPPIGATEASPPVGAVRVRGRGVRRAVLQVSPPLLVDVYRRARTAYRRRRQH